NLPLPGCQLAHTGPLAVSLYIKSALALYTAGVHAASSRKLAQRGNTAFSQVESRLSSFSSRKNASFKPAMRRLFPTANEIAKLRALRNNGRGFLLKSGDSQWPLKSKLLCEQRHSSAVLRS